MWIGKVVVLVWLALLCAWPAIARADNTADEADLQFALGTEAYQRGEYRLALEHFLASNRLVPNKNVLFNIARSYEKLRRFPEAFRYYLEALEGETDAAARAKIDAALVQIRGQVAVLDVTTTPPGATLYVDRRDLGSRGTSPRVLGLEPGRYRIIAELAGYEPAEVTIEDAKAGERTEVRLTLRQVLGKLAIAGPAGASVRVGRRDAEVRCRLPCELELPPGRQSVFVERPGFRVAELPVELVANQRHELKVQLEPLTGAVVVSTDEPGARIEIAGKTRGFTPALVTLPAGTHDVHVSLPGFHDVERRVEVRANTEQRLDIVLTRAEEVVSASRVSESIEDAPSSVTIISGRELRALAYPTIAEALRGTPGLYLWDDRSYVALGVRGLGRLGSYGNRVLVLFDGQPANDDWLGSSYVGYDALSDLGDVETIEVVRGPGSVLYGTNAFSGVINVVSRPARTERGTGVAISTYSNGVARARVRTDASFGEDAGIWTSVSAARGEGRDFYFREYDAPETREGNARGVDGFEAGTLRGRAFYRWLSLQWSLHSHEKQLPTGEYETIFADPRTRQTDTRGFVELRAEPELGKIKLFTRLHANLYRFRGVYPHDPADGGVEVDTYEGKWVGLEQRLLLSPARFLRLTLGVEGQHHFQVEQAARDDSGYFLDGSDPYQVGAAYAVADATLNPNVRVSAGARVDSYSTFGSSINPRASLIVRPYAGGNTKLLGGKAFRAPSVYELYYEDGGFTQIASPDLDPESMYSLELEHSHRFSETVTATASVYANYVSQLIVSDGSGDAADPLHYENSTTPLGVFGGELGLRREWRQGYMLALSYGLSVARFLKNDGAAGLLSFERDPAKREVANAPTHLASFKAAVPILSRALLAGTRLSFDGGRYDRFEDAGSEPQRRTEAAAIWDIVLSGEEPRFGLNYAFGVYNAFDWRYETPASAEFRQRSIPQEGRTFLASAEVTF